MLSAITAGLRFPISADNRTRAQFSALRDDLRGIGGALATVQDRATRAGRSMRNIGAGLTATLTAPIAGLGVMVVRSAMEFEGAMNQVAAVSGASGTELAALESIAREMGATTRFSAQQAAEGLGFLAMAGLSVEEQIGALPGVLQLAAASGMELAEAADVATNVLGGFGFGVDQLQRVNDVLAATASSANTNVQQLGLAFMDAGSIASIAGLEFEEVAAALGLLANAGFRGGRAGTALRGAINRLVNPVGEAAEALERIGLETRDADGNMRPLVDIFRDLGPHAQDAQLMMQLFGQEAGPAIAALVLQGADALEALTLELQNSGGAAAAMAEIMNRGLRGALNNLSSAWGELLLSIADTGLLDMVTGLVDRLTGFVRVLGDADPALLRMGVAAAAVVAGLGPLVAGLGFIIIGASAAIPALVAFGAAAAPVMLVVGAVAALAAGVYLVRENWGDLTGWWGGIWDRAGSIFDGFWDGVGATIGANDPDTLIGQVWGAAGDVLRGLLIGLPQIVGSIFAAIGDVIAGTYTPAQVFGMAWENVTGWFDERLGGLPDGFERAWTLVSGVVGPWAGQAQGWGVRAISALVEGIGNGESLRQAFVDLWEVIRTEVASWPGRLLQSGRDMMEGLVNGIFGGQAEAEAAAANMANRIEDIVNGEFGIQSPSRVFRQIGEFLTEGLAIGIGDGTAQPVEAMRGLAAEVVAAGDEAAQGLNRFGQGFASIVGPILRGTQSIGDAVRGMVSRIGDSLLNSGLQGLGGLLGNILGFGGGGGGGGFLGNLFGGLFAEGAAFRGGSVVPFADGGVIGGPTPFPMSGGRTGLMGEAGAEAIMPLARTASGALGVQAVPGAAGGGGDARIEVLVRVQDDGTLGVIARREGASAALPVALRVVEENNELQAERSRRQVS